MRALVISQTSDFAAVLLGLIEQITGSECTWQTGWTIPQESKSQPLSLIVGVISQPHEFALAEEALSKLSSVKSRPAMILVGNRFDAADKIKFLNLNVVDILDRPVNLQRIRYLIDSIALRSRALEQRRLAIQSTTKSSNGFEAGKTQLELVRKLAKVDATLMLSGETGVGKTYVARQIHELSDRRKSPFVTINCAAIPENLIESELFGHKRGAFTGANNDQVGKFAHAGKGTVLLDELDALPLSAQAKLLHAIEDREFQAVGSNQLVEFKARLIAATNQNLEQLMSAGRFRQDLFYRLDVYEMYISSLRSRIDEIDCFVDFFAQDYAKKNHTPVLSFSSEVLRSFRQYEWPGNLRELRNCIEHAAINCANGSITIKDLPTKLQNVLEVRFGKSEATTSKFDLHTSESQNSDHTDLPHDDAWTKTKDEIKRIMQALQDNNFNRTNAAKELGISRAAFYKKMHRFGLA